MRKLLHAMPLDLAAIRAAHDRIRPYIHRTPVLTSERLNAACGGTLFFKCENFQKVGAFKARGAANAIFSLDEASARLGVATHSSGNHAAAVARAARLRGIPAYIVMPANSAKPKIRAVEGYGGIVTLCEPDAASREGTCARIVAETGAALIHPYENEHVMAGQGTAAIEFLEDVNDLDLLLCPVGGGGLLAGASVAAKALRPSISIIATEPAGASDTAESFAAGHVIPLEQARTIADGLRTTIGQPNFEIVKGLIDGVVTVSEESIVTAMRMVWETMKIVVEPSGAVPYAAVLAQKVPVAHRRVGIILTGGNVDLDALPWIVGRT